MRKHYRVGGFSVHIVESVYGDHWRYLIWDGDQMQSIHHGIAPSCATALAAAAAALRALRAIGATRTSAQRVGRAAS